MPDSITPTVEPMAETDVLFIETYIRQRGDYAALLAIDEVILRTDLGEQEQAALLQSTIQGALQ
jgi:hypothetical protein